MKLKNEWALLGGFALVAVAGALGPPWLTFLLTVATAKALVALGVVVQMRCGLVSFGQALYYCIGGYASGLAAQYLAVDDAFVLLALGVLTSLAVALCFGLMLTRYREIFYAMLTMALSMVLYGVLVKSSALGSTDGFNVPAPTYFGLRPGTAKSAGSAFALTVAVGAIAALGAHRFFASRLGRISEAIRENEVRVDYLGVSPREVLYVNYCVAAVLSALGGGLTAIATGHVDPDMAFWATSGEFVFIAILGGTAHVAAPYLAALVFSTLRTFAIQEMPHLWQMTLGTVLLALMGFLPKGLWSLPQRLRVTRPKHAQPETGR
jgi:ABC-type branched-subunit amino acid transport system permease subunit